MIFATGLVMAFIGFFIAAIFGCSDSDNVVLNKADNFGIPVCAVGIILMVISIAITASRNMP